MTERPLSLTTQIAPLSQTAFTSSTPSISAPSDALPVHESVDEEPYTIKCICDYEDDDGNTIYCETCDTWQHIECYYPGRVADASREEFDHSCSGCKPRPLNVQDATERQRQQRHNKAANDTGDKRSKRPPSKSHKKKTRPSDQINGSQDPDGHRNSTPQETHPLTKKKGHRPSQSVGSQVKRSPPLNTRPSSHGHPPSPAHTPPDLPSTLQVHSYSEYFQSLYDNDQSTHTSTTNSFASLSVTNSMTNWLSDPVKLREEAGKEKHDVFQYLTINPNTLKWPELRIERKEIKLDDTLLQWRYLITPALLSTPGRIGELNGLVGFQSDYCSDVANRWAETVHPRPFIFFHPQLPLFIDTRREGSKCRYVRRSCRPNTQLETFIAGNSEYHFWLTSERQLPAGEQITIPWDFRFSSHSKQRFLHLLNLSDDDGPPVDRFDVADEEYEQLTITTQLVLSDHGGCACDLGRDCAFARFHRSYHGKSQLASNNIKPKKSRKLKQSHVSPTSTGQATNSRAASEGQDQYDEDDNRSHSGSARSKPHSRDMTPLYGVSDTNGIMTELSDREKRKLVMVEDTFRKLENQPPKKKKRISDGSTHALPTTTHSNIKARQRSAAPKGSVLQPVAAHIGSQSKHYIDASTSRRQSGSPFSGVSPTAPIPPSDNHPLRQESVPYHPRRNFTVPRGTYTDSCTQTDAAVDSWWEIRPKPKKSILPLARRLLKNRHKIQLQHDLRAVEQATLFSKHENGLVLESTAMDLDEISKVDSAIVIKTRQSSTPSVSSVDTPISDVKMTDAPPTSTDNSAKPPPPPWPSITTNSTGGSNLGVIRALSSDIHVQVPGTAGDSVLNSLSGNISGTSGQLATTSATSLSPFGSVSTPNLCPPFSTSGAVSKPTKKLSLSDYKARRIRTETSAPSKLVSERSPTVAPAVLEPMQPNMGEGKVISGGKDAADSGTPSPKLEKAANSGMFGIAMISDAKE